MDICEVGEVMTIYLADEVLEDEVRGIKYDTLLIFRNDCIANFNDFQFKTFRVKTKIQSNQKYIQYNM